MCARVAIVRPGPGAGSLRPRQTQSQQVNVPDFIALGPGAARLATLKAPCATMRNSSGPRVLKQTFRSRRAETERMWRVGQRPQVHCC